MEQVVDWLQRDFRLFSKERTHANSRGLEGLGGAESSQGGRVWLRPVEASRGNVSDTVCTEAGKRGLGSQWRGRCRFSGGGVSGSHLRADSLLSANKNVLRAF